MSNTLDRRRFLTAASLGAAAALANGALAVQPLDRTHDSRIKLSCCAYSLRKYLQGKDRSMSLEDFIAKCVEWGLDGVELTSYYFGESTPEYCHQLKRACFLAGIDVSGTAIGNKFAVPAGDERTKQNDNVRKWIDLAVELDAPCMRVFGGPVPKGTDPEEATKWAIEALHDVAPYAAERGVYLALENHGGVTATATGVLAILSGVESEWIGANLDTGNFHSEDPYAELAQVAPYAVNVHLKAEVKAGGKPAQPTDFARVADILRAARYSGYVSLEYESAEDPMTAVPRILGDIRGAFSPA